MHAAHIRSALAIAALAAGLIVPLHAPASAGGSANQDASNSPRILDASAQPALQSQQSTPQSQQQDQQQGPPQDQQQIPQSQKPLRVSTELVNLFATVRDKNHFIVNDLKQEEFHIFEDGVEQKVAYFSKEVNLPITLAILVDTSGSQMDVLGAEQDAASRFIHEVLRKKDEALVLSFDLDVDLLADFTEDTSVLEQAIRRTVINAPAAGAGGTAGTVPGGSNGGTDFYDAVYLAAHDKLASEAGRKAIIALTDAEDTGSRLNVKDAIESAQRADAVVHVLLISDEGFYYRQLMGYSGASVAKKMADETGGRVIEVHNTKSLEKAFDQLSEEMRQQYVLGYYPTNTKRDGSFRKIKLEITRADLKILTRRGYYAPSE
ncbi:MAG: VWA domain-containing protein [Candidatus Acidiferrales bacterium]